MLQIDSDRHSAQMAPKREQISGTRRKNPIRWKKECKSLSYSVARIPGRLLTPKIQQFPIFASKIIKTEYVLIGVRQFCVFRHRKSQFGLTFISIKVCSKSILIQKCDFWSLKLSLDPEQEHDFRNGVPKVWKCKTSTFPIGFLMNIYGNFIEIQQKSLQISREGLQKRDDACRKVWKGPPKVSRKLVHVMGILKCAKYLISQNHQWE